MNTIISIFNTHKYSIGELWLAIYIYRKLCDLLLKGFLVA